MIELGKKYQTRDGRAVRILATDLRGPFPVAGAIAEGDGTEYPTMWTESGEWQGVGNDGYHLIPVPTKHEGWLILHRPSENPQTPYVLTSIYATKEKAERDKMFLLDQVIPVTWED